MPSDLHPPGLELEAPIDPSSVVAMVAEIVRDPWPSSVSGRGQLFSRLGLTTNALREVQNPHIVGSEQHFLTDRPLAGPVLCTWVLEDGMFTQIYFQLRFEAVPPSPETTGCFEEIMRQFTQAYGESSAPQPGQKGFHHRWDANGRELEVRYGNEARSSLMISISKSMLATLAVQDGPSVQGEPLT